MCVGGYLEILGWGGTGHDGGIQPLDGGGSPPLPPILDCPVKGGWAVFFGGGAPRGVKGLQ